MNCDERYVGCSAKCERKKEVDEDRAQKRKAKADFYKDSGYFRDKAKSKKDRWIRNGANG